MENNIYIHRLIL